MLNSSDGHLFDKEAILEYYLAKKKEISRNLKNFEKQKKRDENEINELKEAAHRSKVEKFVGKFFEIDFIQKSFWNSNVFIFVKTAIEKGENQSSKQPSTSSLSNMSGGKAKELPSFWVPTMTPDAKRVILPTPDTNIYCPVSGKILKIKDLIDVKFTLAPVEEKGKALISREVRYLCAVTKGQSYWIYCFESTQLIGYIYIYIYILQMPSVTRFHV